MSTEAPRRPRKGEEIEILVEELDGRGLPVGRFVDWPVRVPKAAIGSRIRVRVGGWRKKALDSRTVEILDPGPAGVEPRCAHATSCGGCSYQRMAYEAQLEALHAVLVRHVEAAGIQATVEAVVPCREPWHYRNKMDFTFGNRRWVEADEPEGVDKGFAVGLHVPGRYDKVLDVGTCHIAFAEASLILASARRLAREQGLSAWDVHTHTGLLRHIVLRKGFATDEILAHVVTTEAASEEVLPWVEALCASHPEITTVVQSVNSGVALVAVGEERLLRGTGSIRDVVGGIEFSISAQSFFQTNTLQAGRLLEIALAEAAVEPDMLVYDLYSGGGLFSLHLARTGARVIGFEVVPEAVRDAERNASANGLDGLRFVLGDLSETLTAAVAEGGERPRVVLVDPPRSGLHERVLRELGALGAERIIYVSCNPKTAVRDAQLLGEFGYLVARIQPVDLFPHTPHLECVMTLVAQ